MKRILSIVLCLVFVLALFAGCSSSVNEPTGTSTAEQTNATTDTGNETDTGETIKIGVSIWSSTDTLGSQCKRILDAAADALGIELMYVDQGHISEQVTASAETCAAAGCDGMIICNSAASEMTSVINTCNENKMYVAQFFRTLSKDDNPDEYALAASSPYYVGNVHGHRVCTYRKRHNA